LTVTSAILLDALLGTFGREDMLAELGFFFYFIAGALFAGGAIWLWAFFHPKISAASAEANSTPVSHAPAEIKPNANDSTTRGSSPGTVFDRQELYEQIRYRLGPDDILDLIFDLGWAENDVMSFHQDNNELIISIIDLAEERGQSGDLALAVERILTPVPAENLPRREKLDADSPQTILRHYLLANYSNEELEQMAVELDIDWELIGENNKDSKVRNLLLYLYRRNRIEELIILIQAEATDDLNVSEEE